MQDTVELQLLEIESVHLFTRLIWLDGLTQLLSSPIIFKRNKTENNWNIRFQI